MHKANYQNISYPPGYSKRNQKKSKKIQAGSAISELIVNYTQLGQKKKNERCKYAGVKFSE
jgi:hypothetical protein